MTQHATDKIIRTVTSHKYYNERLFNTSTGIAALGPNPFVSSIEANSSSNDARFTIKRHGGLTRSHAGHLDLLHARSIVIA